MRVVAIPMYLTASTPCDTFPPSDMISLSRANEECGVAGDGLVALIVQLWAATVVDNLIQPTVYALDVNGPQQHFLDAVQDLINACEVGHRLARVMGPDRQHLAAAETAPLHRLLFPARENCVALPGHHVERL